MISWFLGIYADHKFSKGPSIYQIDLDVPNSGSSKIHVENDFCMSQR
jgi:hypothetical protein